MQKASNAMARHCLTPGPSRGGATLCGLTWWKQVGTKAFKAAFTARRNNPDKSYTCIYFVFSGGCAGTVPPFLAEWVRYCRGLGAGDTPDYAYLRALLLHGSGKAGSSNMEE